MSSLESMGSTEFSGEDDEGLRPDPVPTWWSVAVFMVDRAYGGPEEGGWWYDYGYPVKDAEMAPLLRIFNDEDKARAYRNELQTKLDAEMNVGRVGIGSVLSDGVYQAVVTDDDYPKAYPSERPRFE
jgi:hypothetical protein